MSVSMSPSRPGRPSSAQHPTVAVRHRDEGDVLAWSDGHISGSPERVRQARSILAAGEPVLVGPQRYVVDASTPQGVLPALLAVMRGRGEVCRGDVTLADCERA